VTRDFLDVDAALICGRYTPEQLLELAAAADHGFDRLLFADAPGALPRSLTPRLPNTTRIRA
jgi:alkanesulfonate monooxygenase SsuD/methylene tetrahydromethanopterin reductase-like flavin-dependent oxidoreductase (luciferase family)